MSWQFIVELTTRLPIAPRSMYAVAEGELPIQNVQPTSQAEAGSNCGVATEPGRDSELSEYYSCWS